MRTSYTGPPISLVTSSFKLIRQGFPTSKDRSTFPRATENRAMRTEDQRDWIELTNKRKTV
jgi:hypothetical protein